MSAAAPGLRLAHEVPLRTRNTFGVEATAPLLVEVLDAAALPAAFTLAELRAAPPLVLGGGSNLLLAATRTPPLLQLRSDAIALVADDGTCARVRAEAGAGWHALVEWTLARGLRGLENLALIPGSVGAAPIQNIGAYGVELAEHVHAVEAYDPATARWHRFDRAQCRFGYRDSLFKQAGAGLVVTALELELRRDAPLRLGYAGIREELAARGIHAPDARAVADAVIALRRGKLPDPAQLGNAGSFFKNPLVPAAQAAALRAAHPHLPHWPAADGRCKLSAAWLIEQTGCKGTRAGDAGISDRHALVLVNHGAASGAQLLALAREVAAAVAARFGVALEPEPRIVGATW
ncbi:UDP-N-acetylmuramate dehydrogenase [Thermomonas flagellata]|uniref:UDP-N-acetylmuramate dehydrogenase n=1 Tax=Thermomonas flagellata TaxID=2888524 RepID=UPI001F03BDCC|nr:UDP-N-acetylmuramate dehydrogenase [Thermomonas flagellata]